MIRNLALGALAVLSCVASAQVTTGKSSGMTATQIAKVRKSKYRVLVPTYLPAGFRLTSCGMSDDKEPILASWVARYRNPKSKAEFTIQMASEGLGDPMFDLPNGDVVEPTGWMKVSNPILGKIDMGYYHKGKTWIVNCTWYETKSKSYPKYAMIIAHGLPATQVKQVLQSLRWLK